MKERGIRAGYHEKEGGAGLQDLVSESSDYVGFVNRCAAGQDAVHHHDVVPGLKTVIHYLGSLMSVFEANQPGWMMMNLLSLIKF